MHTFNKGRTTIHHNSDLSGMVEISRVNSAGEVKKIHVPGYHLLAFVAEQVRRARVSAVEDMKDHEVLGVKLGVLSFGGID